MKELAIEPGDIDTVVLSHFHPDHTGGAAGLVEAGSDMTVYGPKALPKELKDSITGGGAKMVEVEESLEICRGVYTTGQLGGRIKEQSLVLRTPGGLIVIVGCAHPGIVTMVKAARDLLEDDVLFVIGGFHLEWATKGGIERVIRGFREVGVRYVGPGHCSGEKGRRLLEGHFGRNYVKIGAGKKINVADLK
ncbi:MAG: MBL fold metallo-hydrolase [Planctomycetota bacterium]|jgi:7,8-dihydropterin-6-yl-methyl-4-(beta-D-ribofuranosyl)aminobenzene 5'-phosphate synthase